MEARRSFQTAARSSKQMWMVVVAALAVLTLGVAGAFLAKSLTSASAPASGQAVQIDVAHNQGELPGFVQAAPIYVAPDQNEKNPRHFVTGQSAPELDRNAKAPAAVNDRLYR